MVATSECGSLGWRRRIRGGSPAQLPCGRFRTVFGKIIVKLLIYSHYFTPSVGGVETIVTLLARKLSDTGKTPVAGKLEVTVATQTPASGFDDRTFPFPVVRTPSLFHLWRLIRSADVVHIAGPSLVPMLLAKLARTPYVVEHHGYQAICPNGVLIHQPDRAICPGHFQAHHYGTCIRCQRQEMPSPRAVVKLLLMFPRHSLSRSADSNIFITRHSPTGCLALE
jgi:glycosyltransferase involved in cell wall biosynthesis